MANEPEINLSRRERQIMDIVYRLGRASTTEIREELPNRPSDSAVRALVRILENKRHLQHERVSNRNVYLPTRPRNKASITATRRLLRTFFDDSMSQAVAALLDASDKKPSSEELDRITDLINEARKKGE